MSCPDCRRCINVCPTGALFLNESSMELTRDFSICMACGHCIAICERSCVDDNFMGGHRFPVVEETSQGIDSAILGRRSIRCFSDRIPGCGIIRELIDLADRAPVSHNIRDREYLVIMDSGVISEMERITVSYFRWLRLGINRFTLPVIRLFSSRQAGILAAKKFAFRKVQVSKSRHSVYRNAPVVILFIASRNYADAMENCILAQNSLMLAAQARGLGTCVIGYAKFAARLLEKYFKLDRSRKIYSAVILGYPMYRYPRRIDPPSANIQFIT